MKHVALAIAALALSSGVALAQQAPAPADPAAQASEMMIAQAAAREKMAWTAAYTLQARLTEESKKLANAEKRAADAEAKLAAAAKVP